MLVAEPAGGRLDVAQMVRVSVSREAMLDFGIPVPPQSCRSRWAPKCCSVSVANCSLCASSRNPSATPVLPLITDNQYRSDLDHAMKTTALFTLSALSTLAAAMAMPAQTEKKRKKSAASWIKIDGKDMSIPEAATHAVDKAMAALDSALASKELATVNAEEIRESIRKGDRRSQCPRRRHQPALGIRCGRKNNPALPAVQSSSNRWLMARRSSARAPACWRVTAKAVCARSSGRRMAAHGCSSTTR